MSIKIRKAPFFRLSKHAGLVLFGSPCHHYYPQLWQASLRHFHLRPGAIFTAQSPLLKHESSRATERERRLNLIAYCTPIALHKLYHVCMPKKDPAQLGPPLSTARCRIFFPSEKKNRNSFLPTHLQSE